MGRPKGTSRLERSQAYRCMLRYGAASNFSTGELAKAFEISPRTIERHLKTLKESGPAEKEAS